MRLLLASVIAATGMFGQTPQPVASADTSTRGSISGVVRLEGSGAAAPNAQVTARGGGKSVDSKADSEGRYSFRLLEPGSYLVIARVPSSDGVGFGAVATRPVTLQPGQELTGIDIRVRLPGRISGRVLDENGEPVANMSVMLVAKEYSSGALRYVFASGGGTDDQGRYTVERVTPGRAFLLLAMKRPARLEAISNAPDDPKMRRSVPVATYYPDSQNPEGGELLTLRAGETREGVDIRMRKAASYCIEGVITGPVSPAELSFSIALQRPTSGASGSGAMFMGKPTGKPGPDGKMRICELPPGDYELEVSRWPSTPSREGPDFLSATSIIITDRDVTGVGTTALPKIPLPGEVAWYGKPPQKPAETSLSINLQSITRTSYPTAKSSIPGQFSFDGLVMDEYSMDLRGFTGGLYLKDVTYADHSVMRRSLRVGSAQGNATLRVLVGSDGGTVAATVVDKDGNPVGDTNVLLIPANAGSEAELASAMQSGVTDQNGNWTSVALAPGKYFGFSSVAPFDKTPEIIDKLWRARTQAQEVDVQPNANVKVKLEVKAL